MFYKVPLHSGDSLTISLEDGQVILEGHDTYLILSPEDARQLSIALEGLQRAARPLDNIIPFPRAAKGRRP